MSDAPNNPESNSDETPGWTGLIVAALSLASLALFYLLGWQLAYLMAAVVLISVVIWQACDPFADAAQWIGEQFRLPGSIRGATLDAIASSMPELFSGIFFVVVAISLAGDTENALADAGAEGYGSTIATCAGSAIYNMILIPAVCAIFISIFRKKRPTIDVESEVVARDGLWFVGCEVLLIVFLFQDHMYWWMAVCFLGLYVVYVVQLYRDAKLYQKNLDNIKAHFAAAGAGGETQAIVEALFEKGTKVSPLLIDKAREEMDDETKNDEGEEDDPDTAGVLFGFVNVRLNQTTAWLVIVVATIVAAAACYFLVETTRATAKVLDVPVFFVAVILAAAASSVPDTFLSIGAAKRGDDSGAVSNAFGSNIFDICICLSIPLLVSSYLIGWEPVSLTQDGKPIPGLLGLRILLVVLTIVTLLIIWHNRQLTRKKAFVLCGLYAVFVAYAILGSLGYTIDKLFSS